MEKTRTVAAIIFNSIIHPSHLEVIFRDLFRKTYKPDSDEVHLAAAIEWLCNSQDAVEGGGCSGIYTFESGWRPPYPETTGYIIPTLIKYGELVNNDAFLERAKRMGDWEIDIQLSSGAVRGGVGVNEYPIVFNTGQVILGWVSLYEKTYIKKYLNAAIKAAEWLVRNQDEDGKWSNNTFKGIPHAYNVRVAWALMKVSVFAGNEEFKASAEKNVRWVLSQGSDNAWLHYMGFTISEEPFTHTIAYTLRGLLECSFYVDENFRIQILQHVMMASETIMNNYWSFLSGINKKMKFLPGTYNIEWKTNTSFSCLTGNAQMSIIWMKLYKITGDERFLNTAFENIKQIKTTQNLTSANNGIRGAIAGSYPIWGRYVNFGYPNWAAKFFSDALMLKNEIVNSAKNE